MKILGQIGNYTIINRETEFHPFICAYMFNHSDYTWAQGRYFSTFEEACKYALNRRMLFMSYDRLEEIATQALSYLRYDIDENLLDDFEENYNLEFSDEELEYFGLPTRE